MNDPMCPREHELLDALGRRFVGAELETHVASCAACSELRLVAGALLDDRIEAVNEAPVPSSGTMWFRMQMRHRRDAQAITRRALLFGQVATLFAAAAVMLVLFGADLAVHARHAFSAIRASTPLLLAVATSLLIAPIAGWVAIRQK